MYEFVKISPDQQHDDDDDDDGGMINYYCVQRRFKSNIFNKLGKAFKQ